MTQEQVDVLLQMCEDQGWTSARSAFVMIGIAVVIGWFGGKNVADFFHPSYVAFVPVAQLTDHDLRGLVTGVCKGAGMWEPGMAMAGALMWGFGAATLGYLMHRYQNKTKYVRFLEERAAQEKWEP